MDNPYYGNQINFDNLQKIVKADKIPGQYEPGQLQLEENANKLPVLRKADTKIKF